MSDTRKQRERARRRVTIMVAVRSGQLSVEDAARELGISRKTYYEWEERDSEGRKLFINQVRDLASGYRLPPIGGELAIGEELAGHLDPQFTRHGAPLLLKQDCAGNLNHSAVDEVLKKHFVLALNRPPYYPPYNGCIENAQGELKRELRPRLPTGCPQQHFEPYVAGATNGLNHKPRDFLGGQCACRRFFDHKVR